MNDRVRQAVRERMKQRGITHAQLAELTGLHQPNVSRLISGRVGKTPDNWQRVLDALELELVAVDKEE